jgi:hypothetical protein
VSSAEGSLWDCRPLELTGPREDGYGSTRARTGCVLIGNAELDALRSRDNMSAGGDDGTPSSRCAKLERGALAQEEGARPELMMAGAEVKHCELSGRVIVGFRTFGVNWASRGRVWLNPCSYRLFPDWRRRTRCSRFAR